MIEKKIEDKVEEKKDERRKFLGPNEVDSYFIAAPSAEDIRGADWNYSKIYTKCLVEGITTGAEMMDILTRRGIIGSEFEQRANELTNNLNTKIEVLEASTSIESKRELAVEVAMAREELFQWNQRLNGPLANTCEQMSDDARLEYLTSCMVQTEDSKKVWDSYEIFLKEKSNALALRSRFEVMLYLQGLESDFLQRTPEAEAMKEVEKDVTEKADAAIKAMDAVNSEEEAVSPKPAVKNSNPRKSLKKDK